MERCLSKIPYAVFFVVALLVFFALFGVTEAFGLAESCGPEGSNSRAIQDTAGPNEIGEDIIVGILGGSNIDCDHAAFVTGNIVNHWVTPLSEGIDWHDTIMAGIIASNGQSPSYADDIGVAPGVKIHSMRIAYSETYPHTWYITRGLQSLVDDYDCEVIVSGFDMSNLNVADGNSQLTLQYDYYAYNNNVVFANPAGKYDPNFNPPVIKITVPGDAYNSITTAGLILNDGGDQYVYRKVGTESLSGITVDGRKKPDIAAPSGDQTVPFTWDGGATGTWVSTNIVGGSLGATSYSGPHTAGVAALLLGLADDSGDTEDGRNEVIKAVIVNSTFPNVDDKTGQATNPADPNNTWHTDRGYGRINALRAYQLLETTQLVEDVNITQPKGWIYRDMAGTEQHSYFLSGQKNHRLTITITWNRKVTKDGDKYEEDLPRFNLDLTIKDPCQASIYSENDTLNNLVKADILLPGDGFYEAILENTTDKSRNYALAFEMLPPIDGDFTPIDYIVDIFDLDTLAAQWLMTDPNLEANLAGNDTVDMLDYAEFGIHWQENDPAYYSPP